MRTVTIAGYDPGGNKKHGVAELSIVNEKCVDIRAGTLSTAEEVIQWAEGLSDLAGIGVDTLTCWSTGSSGWRAADRWLKKRYKEVEKSVISPNGLYGSMGINGMVVLLSLRQARPDIVVSETHPKVLYWALTHCRYDYESSSKRMEKTLSQWLGVEMHTSSEHEWDAVASAYSLYCGITGKWQHDLLQKPDKSNSRLVKPCGDVHFWWPE
jgi:hypothetical protein